MGKLKRPKPKLIVTRAELARLLEERADRISRLIADGMPGVVATGSGRGHETRIDLAPALPWLLSRRDPVLMAARRELAREKAKAAKRENEVHEGSLIPVVVAEREAFTAARSLRESFQNLPVRLAVELVGMSQEQIHERLENEIALCLTAAADKISPPKRRTA